MHRKNRSRPTAVWGMLLALALGGVAAGGTQAQEPIPPPAAAAPAPTTITVPVNGTHRLEMTTKKNIARAINRTETVARVSPIIDRPREVLITGLEPGVTRLTLIDADGKEETYEIVVQMDVEYLRTLLERGVPKANIQIIPAANNTVILQGYLEHGEDIDAVLRIAQSVVLSPDRIINRLRVGGPVQVQLDVVVARVSRSEFRRMGFAFENSGFRHFVSSTVSVPHAVTAAQTVGVNAAAGSLIGGPGNLFLGVINNQQSFFGFLQALRDESILKLMAEPKLVTLSGRPASFLSGGEQAIPVPAGLGQIGVQFEEFGTRLNFLPIVLGDGRIHLEVEPEVSFLDPAAGTTIQGTTVPGRATQRVHTTVELETGQTFVIGGLIQRTVRGTIVKVPIIGDLPFFGAAFSRKEFNEVEEELVVMVTPYLVDALACNQVPRLLPGMETRSPDDFELFLEGILEAPRGVRHACQGKCYVPAHMQGPTAGLFPCGGWKGGHKGHGAYPGGPEPCVGSCPEANGTGPYPMGAANGHYSAPMPAPAPMTVPVRGEEVRPLAPGHGGLGVQTLPDLVPGPGDRPAGSGYQP